MPKIRYELDPHNRLILDKTGRKGGLTKFRRVLDGRFKIDKNNNITYHVKAPPPGENIPHQVKLRGNWSLTNNHELRLTLDKWGRDTFGDQLTLQGEILDVNANSLLFAVTTTTKENARSTYVLRLGGSWKADKNNRLSFRVKKEKGAHDILTFNGAWEVNKSHQIIYTYEKARLLTKKKKRHTLTFKGYWDIRNKFRLSYVLRKGTDSVFDFKTNVGIFKENRIRYEIGIGLRNRAHPVRQTITLFGKWRVKKNIGLVFEIEYEDKRARAIVFGADARLTGNDTVSFRLKNDAGNKDIGVTVELSHKILKGDGQAFLRALKSKKEAAIYAGAAWRW